ncbi:MAG: RhuM family protein [Sulfurimonas sp.]|nr:RhuM family protein [Sulfurimonas sp.]
MLEQVAKDGIIRKVNFYNLDIVISVGYRVNSKKATKFRQWATSVLKEYISNGYAINTH